jgi:hypothetical protein
MRSEERGRVVLVIIVELKETLLKNVTDEKKMKLIAIKSQLLTSHFSLFYLFLYI